MRKTLKSGRALERSVADLYRRLGASRVEHDVELSGHQIDVYVELDTPDRGVHRLAVEAKDHGKAVGIAIVGGYSQVVGRLRRLGQVDEGVIVSPSGFTRQARNAARDSPIRLLEVEDLEAMALEKHVYRDLLEEVRRLLSERRLQPLDHRSDLMNLATTPPRYGALIGSLERHSWRRFGVGFKTGVYGKPGERWCIKVLGMGVGKDPHWYVARGEHIEHERQMLQVFKQAGFGFQPEVLSPSRTARFLESTCGVSPSEAERLVSRNDLLVVEYLDGLPLATETGRGLTCEVERVVVRSPLSDAIVDALHVLAEQLDRANEKGLVHNDAWPANIILTIDDENRVAARLVDFDLAQDLRPGRVSPPHVTREVERQYKERNVPINPHTGEYMRNLDQHLISQTIQVLEYLEAEASSRDQRGQRVEELPIPVAEFGGAVFKIRRSGAKERQHRRGGS